MGGAGWGMGLQMGCNRLGGGGGGGGGGGSVVGQSGHRQQWDSGPSETRIAEHKRNVKETEWAVATYNPMDDNDIVLTSTPGDLAQSACVHVCVGARECVCDVSWCTNVKKNRKYEFLHACDKNTDGHYSTNKCINAHQFLFLFF